LPTRPLVSYGPFTADVAFFFLTQARATRTAIIQHSYIYNKNKIKTKI
jgi:hypothetical protein